MKLDWMSSISVPQNVRSLVDTSCASEVLGVKLAHHGTRTSHICSMRRSFTRCPLWYTQVHSGGEGSCVGHLPTSCKTGDARQICCLLSSWGDVGKNDFFFQPADVRVRLHGSSASGTAAAFLELRAVRPVMRPQLIPKDPNFA